MVCDGVMCDGVMGAPTGRSLLHVSWLMLALSRVFAHTEAKSIIRWGVREALSLELASSPLLLPQHWKVCTHTHHMHSPYLTP